MMPRIMKRESVIPLIFERKAVKAEIEKNGVYKIEGVELKILDDDEEEELKKEHFVGKILTNNTYFSGTLNWKFQRDGYSFNTYPNGDKFLGNFKDDERTKHGFYFWKPSIIGKNKQQDFYHGFWDNNLKHSHGVYLWIDEPDKNEEFDLANFEAYVGNIDNDVITKGAYLIKNGETYYLYYGGFNEDRKKEDDCAYFYSAAQDRLFRGQIKNDIFIKGFVGYYDDEGNLIDICYVEFDEQESVKSIIPETNIEGEDLEKIKGEMKKFRNIVLEKDYFGGIYNDYKECEKFIQENCNDYSIFDDKERFAKVIMICSKYNNDNVASDIKEKL